VHIANPAGTVVEKSKGVVIYSYATVAKAEKVEVKQVAKGAPGVQLYTKKDQEVQLIDWKFDETVEKKIEAPRVEKGIGKVVLVEAAAPAPPVEAPAPTPPVPEAVAVATAPAAALTPEEEAKISKEEAELPSMQEALAKEEGIRIAPLLNLQILGGQYFFEGERGNLSGNLSLLAAPSLKLSPAWTLVPSYSASYQGTKQVVDLVGAGTLFQERMDHRVGVKGIWRPGGDSAWRIKPAANFKTELLQETRDETWGNGLFDYRKYGAGLEAEYIYQDPLSMRVGYDYAFTHFPNYTSLESKESQDFNGQPLARELVGGHILDNHGHALTVGGAMEVAALDPEASLLKGLILDMQYVALYQRYPQQHLVDASGNLTPGLRTDWTHLVDFTFRQPSQPRGNLRMLTTVGLGGVFARSNQNSYDALHTRFLDDYYDYDELSVRPSVTALLGEPGGGAKPALLSLSFNLSQRRYLERPTQDSTGLYQSSRIRQTNWYLGGTLSYPMDRNFSLMANMQYGRASSNMGFQQFYKYDYTSVNYLFGVSYEY